MKIKMPPSVNMVIDSLHAKGFEAYAVGGCVRDTILAREPDDWDITTSASPQQVKEIFDRTVDTGLEHGTVTVLAGSGAHEVTTYRIDGEYEDGRHPKEVVFTSSLAEDLRRRDFTINAMAYNNEEGLVDLFDGIRDLQRKVIRCVGNPTERFSEDALRILRALRFSAQLGFKLDPATLDAIIALAPTLEKISAERIRVELNKLLISKRPEYMEAVYEAGITKIVLPEFDELMKTPQNNPHHCYNVGEHTIAALQHVPADPILRWTMLLHDIAKPACRTTDEAGIDHFKGHAPAGEKMAKAILRRLKFDNETIRQVAALIRWQGDKGIRVTATLATGQTGDISYQWKLEDGTELEGFTRSPLSLKELYNAGKLSPVADKRWLSSAKVYCTLTYGSCSVNTNTVTLTVNTCPHEKYANDGKCQQCGEPCSKDVLFIRNGIPYTFEGDNPEVGFILFSGGTAYFVRDTDATLKAGVGRSAAGPQGGPDWHYWGVQGAGPV